MSTLKEHQEVLLELLIEFDRVCKKNDISYMLFAGSMLGAVRHQGFIPWDDDLDIALLREDYEKLMKLDVAQWKKEYYLQKEFSEHWPASFSKLRKNNTTCLEKYHPKDKQTHQGIYIDIFPIDNMADTSFMRFVQFLSARIVISKVKSVQGYDTNSCMKKLAIQMSKLLPLNLFYSIAIMSKWNKTESVHSFFAGSIRLKKGIFPRCWFTEIMEVPFESLMIPVSRHYHELLTKQYGEYMVMPSEHERKCKVHAIFVDTENDYSVYKDYRDGMKFDIHTRSIR